MALKHHAAPQFFWSLDPPREGAPRRAPAVSRFAAQPRIGKTWVFECSLGLEHDFQPDHGVPVESVPASLGTWSGRV